MKNFVFLVLISIFLMSPVLDARAQTKTDNEAQSLEFDTTGFPQWAKDMRRWDIIAFGVFPFALFFTTVVTDLNRWNKANGMDMSDRRYAPWPLKSAGAVEMTTSEYNRVLLQAAGVAAAVAFTDLLIVLIKRNKERKRIESKPKSSAVIEIKPYGVSSSDDPEGASSENSPDKEKTPETDKSGKN